MENFLETLIKDILISHCPQKFATELKNAEDLDDVIMKITKKFKQKNIKIKVVLDQFNSLLLSAENLMNLKMILSPLKSKFIN